MNKLSLRLTQALLLRGKGFTFSQIGSDLGVSSGRAREIFKKAERLKKYHAEGENGCPYYGLSVRAANCLSNVGIMSRDDAKTGILSGNLHPTKNHTRNLGWKTFKEVCKWAGLKEPKRGRKLILFCPHCGKNL